MSAIIGERSRQRSGAAAHRPDWAADATLAQIIRRILAAGEPQKIVLFGSRAWGDARADSDYDLLLVEPSELPRHKRAARYRRAADRSGRRQGYSGLDTG